MFARDLAGGRTVLAAVKANAYGHGLVEVARSIEQRGSADWLGVAVTDEASRLRAAGVTVVPHAVSLSLGGAEPLRTDRVDHLAAVAEALEAPLVSDHVCFVRAGGLESGHLLPVPRTREALDVLVANVSEACARLPVPLALENIAALLEWPDAEMGEGDPTDQP